MCLIVKHFDGLLYFVVVQKVVPGIVNIIILCIRFGIYTQQLNIAIYMYLRVIV